VKNGDVLYQAGFSNHLAFEEFDETPSQIAKKAIYAENFKKDNHMRRLSQI